MRNREALIGVRVIFEAVFRNILEVARVAFNGLIALTVVTVTEIGSLWTIISSSAVSVYGRIQSGCLLLRLLRSLV